MTIDEVRDYPMLIGGAPVAPPSDQWIEVLSPATATPVGRVPKADAAIVDDAVGAARASFESGVWSLRTPGERAVVLERLADLVDRSSDELAGLETAQTGTRYRLRRELDLPFCVDNLRFFASAGRHLEGLSAGEYSGAHTSILRREPLGVTAGVAPWNYPLMMAIWKVGPALAAGNSVVLKPATATPLTAIRLAELAAEAGVPDGVLNVITGPGDVVGAALAAHPDVDLISLTGDSETGKRIQALAASNLKRVHLELGGKAPFIVYDDADLDAALRGATAAGLVNAGQDCTAATRIYVQQPRFDTFVDSLTDLFRSVRVGEPFADSTDMGSLISQAQVERVDGFVTRAVRAGARAITGGRRASVPHLASGAFYEPTIVVDADQGSEIVQSEVFGPVVAVLPFKEDRDAIDLAHDTRYGLSASVWTRDLDRAMRATRTLRFGTVWVNDHVSITSEMPHGGFRQSGFGKDMSLYSLEEYTRIKHVMVDATGSPTRAWHRMVFRDPGE